MQDIDQLFLIIQRELHFEYVRASGPGGQNVNKVATAVQLRFNIRNSFLPEIIKGRLVKVAAKRISNEGELIIEAKRFRTQEQNRQDAMQRLLTLLRKASKESKPRRKTKPTKASKEKRLAAKKHLSGVKKMRRNEIFD
ncbi:MAG: alternative ribosome rescue aminoacyl-tRNA hydrolase ArfB [Anaerolineales bacterium]